MNVLLITFSFPPAGGVGVLRALSLAKYLPENGLRVDVLTARNAPSVGKDLSLLAEVPAAVTVHHSFTLDLPFALRKALKKILSGRATAGTDLRGGKDTPPLAKPSLRGRLKQRIANLLLPDPQVGWLPFAFPAASRIIREREIDVVLITVPPFSTSLLVKKLRARFPKLPIVLDFRDEWLSTTINLVSFNKNERARAVAQETEREAVEAATIVVAVTEAARLELQTRYPALPPARFQCIPNGFDTPVPVTLSAPARNPATTVLTYIGSVYGSTDPTTFVHAVAALPPDLRARLRLRFIGHIETEAYRFLLHTLGDAVELKGFVPQAEALRAISDTDYLLLITHDRINVAAKFYDYLGSGKPIIAAVHPAGDVRKLLEETRAGVWANVADVESIRVMLTTLLSGHQPSFHPDTARIGSYHRGVLAARYADLLKSIASTPA